MVFFMKIYDVIIIGAGPAGISASIYAKRANVDVLVLYFGESELQKAMKIDNYYGFENGISGDELYKIGIKQAQNLGIEVLEKEIVDILPNDNSYIIKSTDSEYITKSIIIATGNKKVKPNIKGIDKFEGKGISYCAICDGFFYRGKDVAIIGDGNYALCEAESLKNMTDNLKILTNGRDIRFESEIDIDTRKIQEIGGDEKVNFIQFDDGKKMPVDGVFIAQGIAGGVNFARKLGILTKKENIVVDENMRNKSKRCICMWKSYRWSSSS